MLRELPYIPVPPRSRSLWESPYANVRAERSLAADDRAEVEHGELERGERDSGVEGGLPTGLGAVRDISTGMAVGQAVSDMAKSTKIEAWAQKRFPQAVTSKFFRGAGAAPVAAAPAAVAAVPVAAANATSKVGGALKTVGKGFTKIAVPLALGLDAWDYASSVKADQARGDGRNTERNKSVGRIAGSWGGAAIGAVAGQLLIPIPGVGAMIGAGVGSMFGSWFGEKVAAT